MSQIVSKGCGDRKHLLLVDLHVCYLTDLDLTSVHHLCVIYHMPHTYKTNPGDLAGYGGPKGIVGVGINPLIALTSTMVGILRM